MVKRNRLPKKQRLTVLERYGLKYLELVDRVLGKSPEDMIRSKRIKKIVSEVDKEPL